MTVSSHKPGRRALDGGAEVATIAGALVITTTGVPAAAVAVGAAAMAGGKLLWDTLTGVVGHRRSKQTEAYLNRLAKELGEANTKALACELNEGVDSPLWDVIEEGFRTMMTAIDEVAKRCIAVLVADYVVRGELPDREFQLIGGLIAASDAQVLRGLNDLTAQFAQVIGMVEGGNRISLYRHTPNKLVFTRTGDGAYHERVRLLWRHGIRHRTTRSVGLPGRASGGGVAFA